MCCGRKRAAVAAITRNRPVTLEYRGDSTLTVVGSATRTVYWFSGRGARVVVHGSDVELLAGRADLVRAVTPGASSNGAWRA